MRKFGNKLVDPGAVVPTLTLIDCELEPLICTDEGTLHVGPFVTVGMIKQLNLTVPVNAPEGVRSRLKFADWPAVMVSEVGEPELGPKEKSLAA